MSKKIGVVMLGAYPMDATRINGGVQAAFAYLVKGLAQTDNLDLHVLTLASSNYNGPDQVEQANLTIHILPSYPRFERLRNYRTYQSVINKKLAQLRPDLIHAQDAGADALVAIRSGIPTVITVHGIRWEDGKHYSSWIKRVRMYYDSLITERYTVRHAQNMIAISPYVTRYFKDLLRPDIQVYYIPNAIDERFFNHEKGSNKQIVLFAGRVLPRKRVFDLVQAFSLVLIQVPSARLHIAGEISTEPTYVESIRKLVKETHIDKQVSLLGALSEEAIFQEFANCSMLVLPSSQETAPMVIAQAMAAGKPVVATRVGGVAEMVGEDSGRGILVNVGSIDGLATAMTHLLLRPDLQEKMGQTGKAYAEENYHIKRVAQNTNNIYQQIVFKEHKGNV
jgi:glycosyltransferase involved in cell wall biosynthesis